MKMHCGAWWCNNEVSATRRIGDINVCRNCYQRIWERSKDTGETMAVVLAKIEPTKRLPPLVEDAPCSRKGCEVILHPIRNTAHRRWIGQRPICRNCYETVWEYQQKHSLESIEIAFEQVPAKGWVPPPPEPVSCIMPWCKASFPPKTQYVFESDRYLCGSCRMYLKLLARRLKNTEHDWRWYAEQALRGVIPAPGSPEYCAAPWCGVEIHGESIRARGPRGEAFCNTDTVYYHLYMRRHGVRFAEAFKSAPPPRLLHTRGRGE